MFCKTPSPADLSKSAFSRMVLGLHFLSDVIVGIALGLIIGKIVWKIQFKRVWKELSDKILRSKALMHYTTVT